MFKIALLISLAFTSRGRRVQREDQETRSDILKGLFQTSESSAAFNAPSLAVQRGAFSRTQQPAIRMQMKDPEEGDGMDLDKLPKKMSKQLREKEAALKKKLEEEEIEKLNKEEAQRLEDEARKNSYWDDVSVNNLDRKGGSIAKFMYKDGVADVLQKLDEEMIGLTEVKERVRSVASMLVIDKMRLRLGLETSVPSLHMSFTGAPGTGKTTVALRMGQILQRMGYCRTGHVVVAGKDDLVGQYVGHTAPKTKEMIKKAMGGIMLVDEAYYLYNEENERDYGAESVQIITSAMETMQEDLIVIFAGYKDLMQNFFAGCQGLASRVGNHIDFPNYKDDELVDIARVMNKASGYEMTDRAADALLAYMKARKELPYFSNARTVRNAMDFARMHSAVRIYNDVIKNADDTTQIAPIDLNTIDAEDIPTITEEEMEDEAIMG